MVTSASEVTCLLAAWRQGDQAAFNALIPLVNQELRRLAHRHMAGERSDHTLQTTALVNEAYLRLVDCRQVGWRDRGHFFAVSAQLMRRILVDCARSRKCRKRGGGAPQLTFDENLAPDGRVETDLVALDDALEALSARRLSPANSTWIVRLIVAFFRPR